MSITDAAIVLADGTVFEGEAFGAAPPDGVVAGEFVFNTVLSGYQEVISDPSYAGQIIPFTNPHIALIQRNALRSWQAMGEDVEIILIGSDEGIAETAAELDIRHLPDVPVNQLGTPLISGIFSLARKASQSPLLAYVNADIILFPELIGITRAVASQAEKFLMVGQRWDLEVTDPLYFEGDWVPALKQRMREEGNLHTRTGSDYFVFPRSCFETIPDFTVGRAGWDNWMIYQARTQGWHTVDCSLGLDIIHQNHDYRHLPEGKPHYRLPETGENIRLAGGNRTIFVLDDASHRLVKGKLKKMPLTWSRFWRELQNAPLLKSGNYALTQKLFRLLHPRKARIEQAKQTEMDQKLANSGLGGK